MARIYSIDKDGEILELTSSQFDSEDILQTLIEKYPQVLAGDAINPDNPRKWLLVLREAGVPDSEDSGSRWSLDHLLLDQEGIPTLIEVKRSSDTRIRREVVGQMLDYAANAVVYWPVERLRSWFETRCEAEGQDPYQLVTNITGEEDTDAFWQLVKTNLQAKRLRLIFVSDRIPKELQRIIEFLNDQMDPTEVLGVELNRYIGKDGQEALVPNVIGLTATAEVRKRTSSGSGEPWTSERFFVDLLDQTDDETVTTARHILSWAETAASRIWWGRGKVAGSFVPVFAGRRYKALPFSVWTYGRVEINFQYFKDKEPFQSEEVGRRLADELSEILSISIPDTSLDKRPSFQIKVLSDDHCRERFLETMRDVAHRIIS